MKTETNFFGPLSMSIILLLALLAGCAQPDHVFDGTGSFSATEIVVSAEAAGTIRSLQVDAGQKLSKDQVVGQVDTTLLHLQLEQTRAQIKSMGLGIPNVRAQTEFFDQQIQLAKTKLSYLRKEHERIMNLHRVEAATQKQLDDISSQVDQAEIQIGVLENQKKAQTSALTTQKVGLEAKPIPLQAQLDLLREQIRRARIINPREGTILATYAEEGEYTSPGKPLYRLADLGDIHLKAYISGNSYSGIKLNQQVTVYTDDGLGGYHTDTGTVTWISEKAEFTPKTIQTRDERENLVYAIKVSVPNPDGRYKIGMYGEIKL